MRDHHTVVDPVTVLILPAAVISKETRILLTAIRNQIEMLFILTRAGCIKPMSDENAFKEVGHVSDH